MPESAKTLDITILGRTYKVACADGERDALLRTAAYLDAKMAEIRNAGKVSGTERIAVMAALNIAHELLTTKFGGGFDIGEAKRRIAAVEAKVAQFVTLCERLRAENVVLRKELASAQIDAKRLNDKIDGAKSRLEGLINRLPG